MGLMVVNAAFALPFVEALHGSAGVARLVAFDLVNNLLVLTVVNALASVAVLCLGAAALAWRLHRACGIQSQN